MSHIGIWFWDEVLPNHYVLWVWLLVLLRCFAEAARKLRGRTAEGTHAQTTVPPAPMPSESVQAQGKRTYQKKKAKWKEMNAQKAKMKGNETNHNQKLPETLENVVAPWSRKQKLRKQGRGSSRKGYMWNVCRRSWRCGRGSIAEAVAEAVNNFLSNRKEKKTKLNCFTSGTDVTDGNQNTFQGRPESCHSWDLVSWIVRENVCFFWCACIRGCCLVYYV